MGDRHGSGISVTVISADKHLFKFKITVHMNF